MIKSVKIIGLFLLVLMSKNTQAQLHNIRHFSYVDAKDSLYEMYEAEDTVYDTDTIVSVREIEPFYMLLYENSAFNFETFCKKTGYKMPKQPEGNNPLMPVVNITYHDAMAYCKWLSEYYGITFRLPTDQEWEYAASSGFQNDKFDLNGISPEVIYIKNTKNDKPNCITCGQPNLKGLYNMCGNVWELTIASGIDRDSSENTSYIMGGSFFEDADHVHPNTKRNHNKNLKRADVGFRIVASKSDYELLLFIDQAQTLLSDVKSIDSKIRVTTKGVFMDNLFVDWKNGFETFYYDEEKLTAGFCCWVQDLNNLGPESSKEFTFTFEKKDLKYLKKLAQHFYTFVFD